MKVNEQSVNEKLKDFYKENYSKVYYLLKNRYNEVEGLNLKHTYNRCVEAKRISYFTTDDTKFNHRKTIDRLVIDADNGVYNCLRRISPLLTSLNIEYWIILGTDKTDKPSDSGSIIIMYNPEKIHKDKFRLLVKCFNLDYILLFELLLLSLWC